jgi:hypothetical protein
VSSFLNVGAIGAWAYRPPEYNLGRVETVNEKGDVFSLGKVLWAMVNGQRHVVFPGPLWFLDEFDLAMKFPGVPKIHHTMVIIAQTCHIRSEARPTLDQLAANLRELTLSINKEVILTEPDLNARILQKEAQRDIEYQQRRAFAAKFVSAIHADLLSAIESLHRKLPQSSLFREWLNDSRVRGQTQEALINQVANQESDATVTFTFYQKTFLNTRIYPADANGPIRFVASVIDQSGRAGPSELTILDSSGELRADVRYSDGSTLSAPYQSNLIMDFLMNAASQLP